MYPSYLERCILLTCDPPPPPPPPTHTHTIYSPPIRILSSSPEVMSLEVAKYSRLSVHVSRSRRDPLKHFTISVLQHIRCAELRNIPIKQPSFTNEHLIWLLYSEIYVENIVEKGRNSSYPQYFVTCCWISLLKQGSDFLFKISRYSR